LPFQFKLGQKICPTHPARRSRDLPTNDKNRPFPRKLFSTHAFQPSIKKATTHRGVCVRRMMRTILLIILILLLLGALPTWPYSSGWGYYPSGGLGLILLIAIILVLVGRL
jgi:Protein of unknown function (DUF3309).